MIRGYARVSTYDQGKHGNSLEYQTQKLKEAGATKIYSDVCTASTLQRPQFEELMKDLAPGDTLVFLRLDRVVRSTIEGLQLVKNLLEQDIKVHILNIGIMDNTPSSKLIRGIFFAIAEFERDIILERTQEGKAIAKQKPGYREGRPKKFSKEQLDHAMELLETNSYKQVSKLTGISESTLYREVRCRKLNNY